MNNCENCPYGPHRDALSDICDGCISDPNTGWGGFTDHRVGKHFKNEQEQNDYYESESEEEEDE